ncbi:LacI family transcriptional regulator [Actinobacteria bacterium YIM 96077]|uniref:LacI family transcriptional regulator n=1 Tax=Phytoactinopolyspora halophila TaxID=1981511 RepID=A0A329Q9W0_9ACTN|nr:LacI family DNA-binding transcriptional regulator [Phytoactinopolyspora halophila]AYY14636.1 LacI family transcriptional regulator [Actinobacteria bacterium YIM 96077]RAW09200.1 LacI family transcriptional regulator [Phytoactinopolyspora halophila]
MTGIVEVAARAGVSVATVSRALRGLPGVAAKTRKSVEEAAAELGYVASPSAAALPTGRTGAVAVVSPVARGWYFTAVCEGAQDVLTANGYDLLRYELSDVETDRRRVFDTQLLRKRVDAIVIASLRLTNDEVEALYAMNRPVMAVGPIVPGMPCVRIDDVEVGRVATEHLVQLGHRDIAFAGGDPDDTLGFPVSPERRSGYVEALHAAGIEPDPAMTVPAKFTVEAGVEAYAELRSRGVNPTAVFAVSDEVAMGIMYEARRHGVRIPEDLSVVGVDDHDMSWLFGLTTVAQDVREEGRIAASTLIERLRSGIDRETSVTTVPATLVVRSSTRRLEP